jgi:hypothetical protein
MAGHVTFGPRLSAEGRALATRAMLATERSTSFSVFNLPESPRFNRLSLLNRPTDSKPVIRLNQQTVTRRVSISAAIAATNSRKNDKWANSKKRDYGG